MQKSSSMGDLLGSVPSNIITMDSRPRWQRNAGKNSSMKDVSLSQNNSSVLMSLSGLSLSHAGSPKKSLNKSRSPGRATSSKTPNKQKEHGSSSNSLNPKKTPSKTPKSASRNKEGQTYGDRFIPNRSATNFDLSHYLVMQHNNGKPSPEEPGSSSQKDKEQQMSEALHGGNVLTSRILEYKSKAPEAPEGYSNRLTQVYSSYKTPSGNKSSNRAIPSCPERVLDAPDIMDDYYLNLLDWGKSNILAVALKNAVYLWNESTGGIQQLMSLEGPNDYICSVSWVQEGSILAIGDSLGAVQLWDCNQLKQMRNMTSHGSRVSSLSWNSYIISSGSRTGAIHHADVRSAHYLVGESSSHTQEVCGLKWSPDGHLLASGSNDNLVNVWARSPPDMRANSTPLYSFSDHQAAVKALAWCPWQSGTLASGGGTADRTIRFWNCRSGKLLHQVETKSQVCSIVWSTHYKELVSGHGYKDHELIVWKYPSMERVTELMGHTNRVLNLCLSPDGTTVMSAGADESICLWKVFPRDQSKKKANPTTAKSCLTVLGGLR